MRFLIGWLELSSPLESNIDRRGAEGATRSCDPRLPARASEATRWGLNLDVKPSSPRCSSALSLPLVSHGYGRRAVDGLSFDLCTAPQQSRRGDSGRDEAQ